jgi:hypothetical protein
MVKYIGKKRKGREKPEGLDMVMVPTSPRLNVP